VSNRRIASLSVVLAIVILANDYAYGQEVEPGQGHFQAEQPAAVASSVEHVRHMKAHKKPSLSLAVEGKNKASDEARKKSKGLTRPPAHKAWHRL
jgi:hypothetical protein